MVVRSGRIPSDTRVSPLPLLLQLELLELLSLPLSLLLLSPSLTLYSSSFPSSSSRFLFSFFSFLACFFARFFSFFRRFFSLSPTPSSSGCGTLGEFRKPLLSVERAGRMPVDA